MAADQPLALGVSEKYTLNIPAVSGGVAEATADTQWGALRALESFLQLFPWAGNTEPTAYVLASAPVSISDEPRYAWRGVLIDSARHYLTKAALKTTMDAMEANKLNTLHWHIMDDQSVSLVSTTLPLLAEKGAYAPEAVYTHADVSELVEYAYERGIRILPEFDMPGHASSWQRGYPQYAISCDGGETLLNPVPAAGVYDAVQGLLEEFLPLFHSADFIHFGGDEADDLSCWEKSPQVQQFMQDENLPNVKAVRNYFQGRIQDIAIAAGAASVFWEEVFDQGYDLRSSSIVNVWLGWGAVESALKSGHRIISSNGLYLDQQSPAGSSHYFWADTWQNMYLNDPVSNVPGLTPDEQSRIMGMSLAMWGESVDSANIETQMWPRACGGAERMWSDAGLRDLNAAEGRLEAVRCRMVQHGIRAGPIRPSSIHGYCPMPKE